MYRRLVDLARTARPDVFVAIDFPDFNFRLASAVHALGIPVVYYVSPQLWAWRPGRIRALKAFADKVLPIFPFEVEIYERAGVPVEFVGHPLIDLIERHARRATPFFEAWASIPTAPVVALLPGSRPNEVRALLPVLAEAMTRIRAGPSRHAVRAGAGAQAVGLALRSRLDQAPAASPSSRAGPTTCSMPATSC